MDRVESLALAWSPATPTPDALGESPFWHPQESRLYWVDIPGRQLRRMQPGGAVESWAMPSEPGCVAPIRGGGFLLGLRDGIWRADAWQGGLAPLVRFPHDATRMRFNDGKADPLGRFWAGTIWEPRDARRAELYCIDLRPGNGSDGKPAVQLKALNATVANGLAFSREGRRLYWADTGAHVIHAWDWDGEANVMRSHREFQRFTPKPAGWQPGQPGYGGRPDGAALDSAGNYWCAMYEGARLLCFSPAGECLAEVPVPVQCPTMPCFGGPDLRTLYVTSARERRPPQELAERPWSGHVIAARVEVPGLPVDFVIA
ncbi:MULTISPECIES: SMP-30/gluconolactonase/LRE family protein [Ramlibacter]|nr:MULTISPECIES: SMP-30/gluconolactonase/LRE family protein [Ramlibacter]